MQTHIHLRENCVRTLIMNANCYVTYVTSVSGRILALSAAYHLQLGANFEPSHMFVNRNIARGRGGCGGCWCGGADAGDEHAW